MHPMMVHTLTSPRRKTQPMPFRLALLVLAMVAALGFPIGAAQAAPNQTLQAINDYFNSIRTMKGQFVQFGPRGEKTEGQFAIQRPGRVRFFYNPPSTLDVVADGKSVAVRDRRRATQDIWPLDRTPLRFLLDSDFDLTTDAKVTRVDIKPDTVTVVIEESTAFGDGRLTLFFDGQTYELRQWNVVDSKGQETSVSIYNVSTGVAVDPGLFSIDYTRILE